MADNKRHWDDTRGRGWQRILEGPNKGHWEYYDNWKPTGKIDKSGVKDATRNLVKGAQSLTQQYADRQTRLTNEASGKYSLDNIRKNISSMIEQDRSLNDQQLTLGVRALNFIDNLGFFSEDPDTPTTNFAATDMQRIGNEDMTQPRTWQNPEGQVSDEPSAGDLAMFEPENKPNLVQSINPKTKVIPSSETSETSDKPDPIQRRNRSLEEKLVEGSPLDRFKLNQKRQEEKIKIRPAVQRR